MLLKLYKNEKCVFEIFQATYVVPSDLLYNLFDKISTDYKKPRVIYYYFSINACYCEKKDPNPIPTSNCWKLVSRSKESEVVAILYALRPRIPPCLAHYAVWDETHSHLKFCFKSCFLLRDILGLN